MFNEAYYAIITFMERGGPVLPLIATGCREMLVLTGPTTFLDDGRGLARKRVLRHKHEAETGRTSSIAEDQHMRLNAKGANLAGKQRERAKSLEQATVYWPAPGLESEQHQQAALQLIPETAN